MRRGVSVQDLISCAATHGHVFLHTVSTLRDSAAPADEESDVKYADLDSVTALQELVTQQQQDQERLIGTVAHVSNEVEINKEHIKVETFYLSWVYTFFAFALLPCFALERQIFCHTTPLPSRCSKTSVKMFHFLWCLAFFSSLLHSLCVKDLGFLCLDIIIRTSYHVPHYIH